MTNHRFISILVTVFLLFFVILGGAGCGGGHSSFLNKPENENVDEPNEPTPDNMFTVTFDSNGGSEVTSIKVTSGSTIEAPTDPTKEGYIFAGWYKDNTTFNKFFVFGTDGEKITSNITLYTQWLDPDTLIAEYALSEVTIGYAAGDNPKYVTRNLTLPTKIGSADISWTGDSGAVSSNGTVTRQDTDTDVTLTATASYNGKISSPKTFEIKVIKKRTRVNSEIAALTIDEAKVGDVSIERNASGQITDIEGQYVNFDINNADDALDAITVLRNELGIKNPASELETLIVTSDKYSSEYSFRQIYESVPVFGRIITVSVNSFAKGDFIHSSVLSSDIFANSDMKITLSKVDAETIAKNHHGGSVEVASDSTELVIYSLKEYEYEPVYAYIVNVKGVNSDGIYIANNVFINATSGKIIGSFSKILDAILVSGNNEHNKNMIFPVSEQGGYFCMVDTRNPNIEVYNGDVSHGILFWKQDNIVKRKPNEIWDDSQQVSAYTNMREIMDWWKSEFNRNSLDDNGMTVQIVTHDQRKGMPRDNAAWNLDLKRIYISDAEECPYSSASAVDVLTHESTHAVMQYTTCFDEWNLNDTLRAIGEGYADIFACVKDKNWLFGETLSDDEGFYERDIANRNIRLNLVPAYKKSIYYVSQAAYLMHVSNDVNGLTWDELGQVWYRSMRKGISANSDFMAVRRCVVQAAQEMNFSQKKLEIIKSAFEKVGLGTGAVLSGIVTYFNTDQAVSGATVSISDTALFDTVGVYDQKIAYTRSNGNFLLRLRPSTYDVGVGISDYVPFTANKVIIESGKNIKMNIQLVRPGAGSVSGTIIAYTIPATPIEGVTLKIRFGWNNQSDDPILTTTTDANGQYSFDLGDDGAGYYTIEMIKDGYTTSTFNVTVSGQTKWKDEYLERKDVTTPDPVVTDIPIDEAHFPDAGFRAYINDKIDSNKDSILNKTEIQDTTKIDVGFWNYTIHSLQGIEYFINLEELRCSSQFITSLDLSKNIALQTLYCGRNNLTTLNISGCNMLKYLDCNSDNYSKLTTLDVSHCIALEYLSCTSHKLTELNVSKNTALKTLYCDGNQLTVLDVSKNTTLQYLGCSRNQLTVLDVSNNNDLQRLDCSYNNLIILDVSKNVKLQRLTCWSNQLTELNVSGCSSLEEIYCSHNQLTELDLAENTALQELSCRDNQLIELDLTKNVVLSKLECRYNQLTVLDVSHCYQYINVYCDNNVIVTYPPSRTTSLSTANSNALEDTSIIVANLPTFIAGTTGEYSFNVSLDKIVSAESTLIFKNASENLFGVFLDENGEEITMPTTTSLDRVKVSALFDAGVTYSPVIIAQSDETLNNSGGCNGEACGIFTLSLLCILAQKVQHKHNKKRR